ncbi:MAG TPA: hypothetical protein VFS05_01900 [Gemmatimonadaceae bacterium]|nr:hypothetical protein [Gemmatimonadaceae bacterium]
MRASGAATGVVCTAAVCALCTLGGMAPPTARAQAVAGLGEDALALPRGVVRVRFVPTWTEFDTRYGLAGTEPLAADWDRDSIGPSVIESLAPLQTALRALTGLPGFGVTLGRSVVRQSASIQETPIIAEVGVASWLLVRAVVPIVRTRSEVSFDLNPAAREGNIGPNPAFGASAVAARTQNSQLVSQLLAAAAALEASAGFPGGGCGSQTTPQCALVNDTRAMATGIAVVYGTTTLATLPPGADTTGAVFVPATGTAGQAAIGARIAELKARYPSAIGDQIQIAAPFGATTILGADAAQVVFTDTAFGYALSPVQSVSRTGIGDVEVGAKLVWLNTLAGDRRFHPPRALRYRGSISAGARLPTGTAPSPDVPFDLGTGDGQTDVMASSENDFIVGKRFWMSVAARYTVQLPDRRVMRVTPFTQPIAPLYTRHEVSRDLGDYLELEVTPRIILGDYFSAGAQYYFRRKGEDRYTGTFEAARITGEPVTLDAAVLDAGTRQEEHRVAAGIAFSTLAAKARGRSGLPAEVSFRHEESVSGSGGRTPKIRRDVLEVRVYAQLFGGAPRAAAAPAPR